MARSSSGEEQLVRAAGGTLLIVAIAMFLPAYGLYCVLRLVVRAYWRYPHNQVLWYALASWLGSWLLVIGAAGLAALGLDPDHVVGGISVVVLTLTTIAIPLTALFVVRYEQDQEAHRPVVETTLTDILPNPWWPPSQP